MYTIRTLNNLAPAGLARLSPNLFQLDNDAQEPQGILVRSAELHGQPLPQSLLAIARAGAGVNNIPLKECNHQGIVVFNTPGANSSAVAELVIGAMILASRNLLPAAQWAQGLKGRGSEVPTLVEKGKKQFIGPELAGKKLGVIGLGAIGVKVANAAAHLGMEVYGYDPYMSVDAAWHMNRAVNHCVNLSDILTKSHYITLHIPCNDQTQGFLNASVLAGAKPGVRVFNFARGELVDEQAMVDALSTGRVASYVTDFPTDALLDAPGAVCIPHLGASTPESEENCAVMAAEQLADYLLNGNITNSVNLPDVSQPRAPGKRICVLHRNEPGVISSITALTTQAGLNIENMVNKAKNGMAYTMLDATGRIERSLGDQLAALEPVVRVRIL